MQVAKRVDFGWPFRSHQHYPDPRWKPSAPYIIDLEGDAGPHCPPTFTSMLHTLRSKYLHRVTSTLPSPHHHIQTSQITFFLEVMVSISARVIYEDLIRSAWYGSWLLVAGNIGKLLKTSRAGTNPTGFNLSYIAFIERLRLNLRYTFGSETLLFWYILGILIL